MRINNFKLYSKNTPAVIKRAEALHRRFWQFAEQRHTPVVHQIIGNNRTICMSSQLETVKSPVFAKVSAAYRQPFKSTKKGQNTDINVALPLHAENKYGGNAGCGGLFSHNGDVINNAIKTARTIINNSTGVARPVWVKNIGRE